MSDKGVIKQIIGAVIDVEFDKDQIPNIYGIIGIILIIIGVVMVNYMGRIG